MKVLSIKKVLLFCASVILIPVFAGSFTGAAAGNQYGEIEINVHGDGKTELTDAQGNKKMLDSGQTCVRVPLHSFLTIRAAAENEEVISVSVKTENGISLEPESVVQAKSYTREITVSTIKKVVNVTFGQKETYRRAARASAGGDERFPETGDRFSGSCQVVYVNGGNGHTVHGVTLDGFTGILAGEGKVEVDCSQRGAAAPVEGMEYIYTYTVISVDKNSGTVQGNVFATAKNLAAVGTPGTEGYQRGYQSLSGEFNIHREYCGYLKLEKVSAVPEITDQNSCYQLSGARYGVYEDGSCTKLEAELTAGADGRTGTVELTAGRYYVKEISAPQGYAVDGKVYTADVAADETVTVNAADIPQNAPVKLLLKKIDQETGESSPQGAASFENAEFAVNFYGGFYDEDPALSGVRPVRSWVLRTDGNGELNLTDEQKVSGSDFYKDTSGRNTLPLGTVTFQEIKPPEGCLINNMVYVKKIMPSGNEETVEGYQEAEIPEYVIRGDLQIVKFRESRDESADRQIPLSDICFEITSVTTGKTEEIVTDENGYASTEQLGNERGGLPFDTYVVREKNTPEGLEKVDDFNVTVARQDQTLYYILKDSMIISPVRIVKTDATTGKKLPFPDTAFQLLDHDKNVISMTTYYPHKEVIDVFRTGEDGTFILPDRLPAGEYYLREVEAPEGYLLGREDLKFEVKESGNWEEPLEIEFPDYPAVGKIHLTKKDKETGDVLQGAEFTITAAEDIITPDGTLRIRKGETADVIVTDQRGEAQSGELFLGKYRIAETRQPEGYAKDTATVETELKYKDQYTMVVLEKVCFENVSTKMLIDKRETGTDTRLPGVVFEVWEKGTENRQTVTTGQDGTAVLSKLSPGSYCVQESRTVPGYVMNDAVHEFTVDEEGKIEGKDMGVLVVENDATEITGTRVHNAATKDQNAEAGRVEAVDTVSMEHLQPGISYRLRGVLADGRTGEPLREGNRPDGNIIEVEKEFEAAEAVMDVDMHFEFDASELEGWTVCVFEYLYENEVLISSHEDLTDKAQQLYITGPDKEVPEKIKEEPGIPSTGDVSEDAGQSWKLLVLMSALMSILAAVYRYRRTRR